MPGPALHPWVPLWWVPEAGLLGAVQWLGDTGKD